MWSLEWVIGVDQWLLAEMGGLGLLDVVALVYCLNHY